MSQRYYVSTVVVDTSKGFPRRMPRVQQIADPAAESVLSEYSDTSPWALSLVDSANHGKFASDPGVDPLPVFPLDGKLNAIQTGTWTALVNRLKKRGVDPSAFVSASGSSSDGFRNLIRGLGQLAGEPSFSEDAFDLPVRTA